MEPSFPEEFFSEQWNTAVTAYCELLERNDLRRISCDNTFVEIQSQFPIVQSSSLQPVTIQGFAMLSRRLTVLEKFMKFVSNEASPKTDSSIFGLSQEEEGLASRIPRMLRDVCHRIGILNNYCDHGSTVFAQTKEACFEIALVLLSFAFEIVKFIREDGEYSSLEGSIWQPLEQQFTATLSEIDEAVSRLEKVARITKRSGSGDQAELNQVQFQFAGSRLMIPLPIEEKATLPCFIFPTARTSRFFNRVDVGIQIDRYFGNGPDQSFRSLALYGLGGVGKSCVALKYAEARQRRNDLDAMFWIFSEKEASLRQSFTEIAMRLKLPNAQPRDHDENRTSVLNWLQNTRCRWLIIYDNVEELNLLSNYWPTATQGQALITTRNRNFAFQPADGGLEITTWDAETGSQFLLHLLSTDISAQLTKQEATSAHELSLTLSGHALAISHMAGLIYRRSWSITEFVEKYKRMPDRVPGVSTNGAINALWDFSFESLTDQSRRILGIMTFLAPDSIPQALFETADPKILPDDLKFCADPFKFSKHVEILLTLALIKRDKETRAYSVHRLVQSSFKHFMTLEQRQECFNDATILVASIFPKRDPETAQLYQQWAVCSLYLQHVLSLRDCFPQELKANPKFSALGLYCQLNGACQRYLIEINGYNDNLALFEVNALAMKTMSPQSHHIQVDLEGDLASHKGQLLVRLGILEEGIDCLRRSYDVFLTDEPFNPRDSAWCAENLANGIATSNDWPEAIKWQEKAREHWLEYSEKHCAVKTEWPAILKKSMGTTLLWAGQTTRAIDLLVDALAQIEATKPYNWAVAAFIHYELGTLDRFNRDFESAEAHYMEAQNKWLTGDNLRSDPFNGACMYRLGCVALDQGRVEAAIKHLQDSSVVTDRHKARMVAEHARTLFKLSEALTQELRSEREAQEFRCEAERLLLLRDNKTKITGLEKAYDDLICILWR